ncbi:MAG: hypothetical protein ACO3Y3_12530, partial [Phycisphaerales bacterium]
MKARLSLLLPFLPLLAGLAACTPTLARQRFRIEELDARTREITSLDGTRSLRAFDDSSSAPGAGSQAESDRMVALLRSGAPQPLTLTEVREQTLVNNLGIQATLLSPEIAAQRLRAEQAKFESTFTASVIDQRTVSPAYYGGPPINTEAETLSIVPGLTVPLQTGGTVSLDWTLATQLFSASADS